MTATSSQGVAAIPAIEIDVSQCHALLDNVKPLVQGDAEFQVKAASVLLVPVINGVLGPMLNEQLSCSDRALAEAVLEYINGALPAIAEELANPDGKVLIPSVSIKPCS